MVRMTGNLSRSVPRLPRARAILPPLVVSILSLSVGCATGTDSEPIGSTGGSADASLDGPVGGAGGTSGMDSGKDVSTDPPIEASGGSSGDGGKPDALDANAGSGGGDANDGSSGNTGMDAHGGSAGATQDAADGPSDAFDASGGNSGSDASEAGGGAAGALDAAAGSGGVGPDASGGSAGVDASAGSGGIGGSGGSVPPDVSVDAIDVFTPDAGCTVTLYDGEPARAAMLVVLDRSESMAGTKWQSAAQAIVQALDQDVFDSMWVGLYAAPVPPQINGPPCIFGFPVDCQAPPFPQIALAPAGINKSWSVVGVRKDIMQWLNANYPVSSPFGGDASPLYAGLQAAINALKSWPVSGKRILLAVTDGTLSCNQLSNPPRPGFPDCNGCTHDWEHPNNLVQLLGTANADPAKPIESFVVGVPGADTYDPQGCNYPPYHMRLALSAIAWAGSPGFVDPNCTGKTFTQSGGDPTVPCHYDMTQGNFNAQNLADAISQIRTKTVGCTFALPKEDGAVVDPNMVNAYYTINGGPNQYLLKRVDPGDPCTNDGCWDYDANGDLQLIGKACNDVKTGPNSQVTVAVGCATSHK